ncbi:MAG: hypothetical protein LBS74_02125 [Oscillospiraceae bacterium]|jgi:hypothetical protein|nr:hypothetical protein [Oscillospiraceae bacterium]
MDFIKELGEMRRRFALKKGKLGEFPEPDWITPEDTLYHLYYELPTLLAKGEIHYGCLVQANSILFKLFPHTDCPANFIFSTGEYDENPMPLAAIAHTLYSYKNTNGYKAVSDAPEYIKKITDSITDEYERLYNVKFPTGLQGLTPNCYFTTLLVHRRHIPQHRLKGYIFPLLTLPQECQSTIILPKMFWSAEFYKFYKKI